VKKIVIISTVIIFVVLIFAIVAAVIISFAIIKPTTEEINRKLVEKFTSVVSVPKGILPPAYSFDETNYFWEMETLEHEVTGVKFRFTTAFSKNQNKLQATLEMPEGSDVSLFNKVLPAIITDKQSLDSALDVEKANLSANEKAGYSQIKISVIPQTKQAAQINWEFEKNSLGDDLLNLYSKLNYPEPLLKFLYGIPHLIFSLLSG